MSALDWDRTCEFCGMPAHGRDRTFPYDGTSLSPVAVGVPGRFACLGCFVAKKEASPESDWRWISPDDPVLAERRRSLAPFLVLARTCTPFLSPGFVLRLLHCKPDSPHPETARKAAGLRFLAEECSALSGRCAYCRDVLTPATATLDHRNPLVRGGPDEAENETWACEPCNTTKTYLTDAEYLAVLADDTSVAVPAILDRQERFRRNAGLPLDGLSRRRAEVEAEREEVGNYWTTKAAVRESLSWARGEGVTKYDWSTERGPFAVGTGRVTSDRAPREQAPVATDDGRNLLVYKATFREMGLPFEETMDNNCRWIPDRHVAELDGPGLDGIFRNRRKSTYLRSFVRLSRDEGA